jgi:hypothetical protein
MKMFEYIKVWLQAAEEVDPHTCAHCSNDRRGSTPCQYQASPHGEIPPCKFDGGLKYEENAE